MIYKAEGEIAADVYAAGHYIYPAYLIRGAKKRLMIEAGINLLGPTYLKDMGRFFSDETGADYALVTQSHYDHLGALSYLKEKYPGLMIGASPHVASLVSKPSVLKTMNFLSGQLGDYFKDEIDAATEDVTIRPMKIDWGLKGGDIIHLGGCSCQVFETPGHTRDHLSFYFPEKSLLFPGEALGNPAGDGTDVKVEFVSSYTDYVDSMEKLCRLSPRTMAMSHMYVYGDDDVKRFMGRTLRATVAYRDLIVTYLDQAHGEIDAAVRQMTTVEYDRKKSVLMERNAYIANLTAQIKAVHAACGSS